MKITKIIIRIFLILTLLVSLIGGATLLIEKDAATPPQNERTDITAILEKEELTAEDYDILWEQTGLSSTLIDTLRRQEEGKDILLSEQERFFAAPAYQCNNLAVVSMAEVLTDPDGFYPLYDLQPGDVLLTKSTHTLFWRHGHSALYLGDGEILEATAIGKPTAVKEARLWGYYPSGIHLRLKDSAASTLGITSAEAGESAAAYAREELTDDRYRIFAGAFGIGTEKDATQCAHLIWTAYAHCGIEVSSRDFPVTPTSLLDSGKFEILRYWGFDPKDINW